MVTRTIGQRAARTARAIKLNSLRRSHALAKQEHVLAQAEVERRLRSITSADFDEVLALHNRALGSKSKVDLLNTRVGVKRKEVHRNIQNGVALSAAIKRLREKNAPKK